MGTVQVDRPATRDPVAERRRLIESLRPQLGTAVLVLDDDGPVLSTREVALLFRVCSATVRRWAETGRLEARRTPGGRWTFPVSGVRRAVEAFGGNGGAVREPQS